MAKILFVLMPNYRDEEFTIPYEMLIEANHSVNVTGLQEGPAIGSGGHKHVPNHVFSTMHESDFATYDALVIPGGPGSIEYLWENEQLNRVIKQFHEDHKIIASICYAVIAVVKTGILRNKHATVYPTDESKSILEEYGVRFSKDGCVALAPEKIITAQGPSFAKEFGQAILTMLNK